MIHINELIHYLGASDGDDDVLLEIERNAVAFVQNQTGHYFGPVEMFEGIIEGDGTRKLWLPEPVVEPPIEEVDEYEGGLVSVAGAVIGNDPEILTDFLVRSVGAVGTPGRMSHLLRTGGGAWTKGYEYSLVYWRGFPAGEEPGDIRQLVLDLCSVKWTAKGEETLKGETAAGYAYTRFDASDLEGIVGAQPTLCSWRKLVYA